MAATTKEILAKLRLDSKGFNKGMSNSHKNILKFSAAVTAVTAAVLAVTKMTANYRDNLTKTARAAGASVEDFSGLKHAADLSGISMEQLAKNLQKMIAPVGYAKTEMDRLGITMKKSTGEAKTQNELLGDLADRFKAMKSPAEMAASAYKIFGARGASMVNMLKDGAVGIKEMTEEARKMGLVFDEEAGKQAEKFNDDITRLTGSIKGLTISIGGSIINFLNEAGIIEVVTKAVQAATQWWNNLDESTKDIIFTVGSLVASLAALSLAVSGFSALAPVVLKAVTIMTGGLNLFAIAIAALIVAIMAFATTAIKYWDQVKSAMEPLKEAIVDTIDDIIEAFSPIVNIFKDIFGSLIKNFREIKDAFLDWIGYTDESSQKISVFGTIVKTVMAAISAAIISVTLPFRMLFSLIRDVVTSVKELGKSIKHLFTGNLKEAEEAAKKSKAALDGIWDGIKNKIEDADKKMREAFKNLVVEVKAEDAKKTIENVNNLIKKIPKVTKDTSSKVEKALGKTSEGFQAMNKEIQAVSGTISGIAQPIANMLNNIASSIEAGISKALDATMRQFDYFSAKYSEALEREIEATEEAEEAKIAALNEKYDTQIRNLENAEARKTDKIKAGAANRMLALDEEYQAIAEAQEEEFERWMEQEAIRFEAEKELMLEKALDKEQRNITETLMDADFKAYMENQQAFHNQKMDQMATNYATKKKEASDKEKADIEASEALHKQTLETLEEQKNEAITTATENKDNKLAALEEKRQAEEKRMKKLELLMNWRAEKAQIEQAKGMKIANLIITGIANAAMAFAMAAGTIPIVGIILGAVLMAAVLAMTFASVAQVARQTVPPPVGLFLQEGGVVRGPSHSMGGVPAELEGGEGVMDVKRTNAFLTAADEYAAGYGKSININFESGSIINNGDPMSEAFLDKISYKIARRVEGLI